MNNYVVISINKNHLNDISTQRLSVANSGFIPLMGRAFFRILLHTAVRSKYGIGLVCKDIKNDEILGFIVATTNLPKLFTDIIKKAGIRLCIISFLKILFQPSLLPKLINLFREKENSDIKNNIKAEWLTLVVKDSARGQGIAQLLTNALIEEYKKEGISQFISTVPTENEISNYLHKKNGFKLLKTYIQNGEKNIYYYDI